MQREECNEFSRQDTSAKGGVTGQRGNRSLIVLVVIIIFKHSLN